MGLRNSCTTKVPNGAKNWARVMKGILKRRYNGSEFTAHLVQYFVYFELKYDDEDDNTVERVVLVC